jgi:hypothetical protein
MSRLLLGDFNSRAGTKRSVAWPTSSIVVGLFQIQQITILINSQNVQEVKENEFFDISLLSKAKIADKMHCVVLYPPRSRLQNG